MNPTTKGKLKGTLPDIPANPKKIYGDTKVPLDLMSPIAMVEWAAAAGEGAHKYGAFNWHENDVEYMTYVGAIYRHVVDAICGVKRDKDSDVHPLGHVMACCAILIDAEANGKIIDNRPKLTQEVLERMEEYRASRLQTST